VDGSGISTSPTVRATWFGKVTGGYGIIHDGGGQWHFWEFGRRRPATSAPSFTQAGVAVDGSGNLYIADFNHGFIRKVTGGDRQYHDRVAAARSPTRATGGPANAAGLLHRPWRDGSGNLYIADFYSQVNPCGRYCNGTVSFNERIRMVAAATGIITTVAGNGTAGYSGDGGPATGAQLNGLALGVAVDGAGNVYVRGQRQRS